MKRIVITQESIDECVSARKEWYNPCPILKALRQRFPNEYVMANGTGIVVDGQYKYRMPSRVKSFMTDWDNKRPVKPLAFWLFQKNRPWTRLAKWFNKLPQVKKAKDRWYSSKIFAIMRKKEVAVVMTKYEKMQLQAKLDSQAQLELKLSKQK